MLGCLLKFCIRVRFVLILLFATCSIITWLSWSSNAEGRPNPSVINIPLSQEHKFFDPDYIPLLTLNSGLTPRSVTEPVLMQKVGISRSYFTGKLGRKYKLQMDLRIDSSNVSGSYYYKSAGVPLELKGEIDGEGIVSLSEFTKAFEGKFVPEQGTFEGKQLRPKRRRTLRFKLQRVAEHLFLETKESAIEVHSEFPRFLVNSPKIHRLNMDLLNTITADHYKFVYEGRKIYETGGGLVPRGWERHYESSIKYYSEDIISLFTSIWEYTGGAHGNTRYSSLNLWAQKNNLKTLKLADLFISGSDYIKTLSTYCIEDLQKQGASYVTGGEIKSFDENSLSTFWIKPSFIGFAFQPYSLGPHAEGSYIVRVPYTVLKSMINPEGPLQKIVEKKSKKSKKRKRSKRRRRRR